MAMIHVRVKQVDKGGRWLLAEEEGSSVIIIIIISIGITIFDDESLPIRCCYNTSY